MERHPLTTALLESVDCFYGALHESVTLACLSRHTDQTLTPSSQHPRWIDCVGFRYDNTINRYHESQLTLLLYSTRIDKERHVLEVIVFY